MAGELTVRPASEEDLDFVVSAESDPEASPFITVRGRDRHLEGLGSEDEELLIVLADGEPVGFALLTDLRKWNRSVEIHTIVITRRNEGIGRAAIELLLERCFSEHGAHRVWLDALGANPRAQHLYESMGFVREGELREVWQYEDGSWDSLVYLSMLESEWVERGASR